MSAEENETTISIKHLICDDDIVEYLIDRKNNGSLSEILPHLQTVNRLNLQTSFADYKIEKEIQYIMKHVWKYANTYRFSTTGEEKDQESYWYMMDEVGCSFMHSDVSNVEVHPFIYCADMVNTQLSGGSVSPDPSQRITYNITWPKKDIKKDEIIYRDYLPKINEDEFRSARLCVWFNTPEQYYTGALELYNQHEEMKDMGERFELNQQRDSQFLDELKQLDRPVKVLPVYVSF